MEDAVDYYNAISGSYEKLYRDEQIRKIKFILKHLDIDRIGTVLDIGAGTGIFEEFLKDKKVIAIEPSSLSDEIIKKDLKNVNLIRSRVEEVNLNERFDLVICLTTLQDLNKETREICLEKAFEYCKEGGEVIISVLKASQIDLSYLKPMAIEDAQNDIIFFFRK
ncbi:MAG: class I SAM-dependent methyltransferase [Candidatus Acidifodinimicrobium sp.]